MKHGIYVIRDKKMCYHQPFVTPGDVIAIRSLEQGMLNPDLQMSKYPEDFALYKIGEFEDEEGVITPEVKPKLLMECLKIVREQQNRSREAHSKD